MAAILKIFRTDGTSSYGKLFLCKDSLGYIKQCKRKDADKNGAESGIIINNNKKKLSKNNMSHKLRLGAIIIRRRNGAKTICPKFVWET